MSRVNENYLQLPGGYLFPEISRRVRAFEQRQPGVKLIRLGIGDVVLPLAPSVCEAMHRAVDEMGTETGFRGYGPEQGYAFLREAIVTHDFGARGVTLSPDEVFVSDGSKCDSANIQEIFSLDASIAVPDPVYPVYLDTNVMAGRAGGPLKDGRFERVTYLPCTVANGFRPEPPAHAVDLVYLCFPNNPTGAVADRAALQEWVRYAQRHRSILLFDAAYEAYITDPQIPHSIFEIPGAREVAIEFRSYSKSAGFTGTRCAYIVIPEELKGRDASGKAVSLHALWTRRHTTKFNGVSYPIQVGAAATYSERGRAEVREQIAYYLANARVIREGLAAAGLTLYGGINAPYIWVKTPGNARSWDFFDQLLERAHVVVTPGAGFGACGEGYFRVSAFGKRAQVEEAVERIKRAIG